MNLLLTARAGLLLEALQSDLNLLTASQPALLRRRRPSVYLHSIALTVTMAPRKRKGVVKAPNGTSSQATTGAADGSVTDESGSFLQRHIGGSGPVYLLRQFGGFLMALMGALILATGYSEKQSYLPFGKDGAVYFSLAFIVLGAIVHELRPFKVRSKTVMHECMPCHAMRGARSVESSAIASLLPANATARISGASRRHASDDVCGRIAASCPPVQSSCQCRCGAPRCRCMLLSCLPTGICRWLHVCLHWMSAKTANRPFSVPCSGSKPSRSCTISRATNKQPQTATRKLDSNQSCQMSADMCAAWLGCVAVAPLSCSGNCSVVSAQRKANFLREERGEVV